MRVEGMTAQTFILPPDHREPAANRMLAFALAMLPGKRIRVEVSEYRKRRSDEQNRYLWGCVYPAIISAGGEQLRGWTSEDVHEYLLGEIYGWETLEGFGRKRLRPLRRSSKMTTVEFSEYVAQIQQRMAVLGIYVPDPGEARWAA
jgi:hypothetical protein